MSFELSEESIKQVAEAPQAKADETPPKTAATLEPDTKTSSPKTDTQSGGNETKPAPAESLKDKMEFTPKEKPAAVETPATTETPPAEANFHKLRENFDKVSMENKILKRKVGDVGTLDKITQERDSYAKELRLARAESSPEFQKEWENKFTPKINLAKAIAGAQGSKIETLLSQPPSDARDTAIEEIRDELSPLKQGRLDSLLNEVDQLHVNKDIEIGKLREEFAANMEKNGQLQVAQAVQHSEEVFDVTLEKAADAMDIFQLKEGEDAHNAAVQERAAMAKGIYMGNMPEEDMAKAALWAASAPGILEAYGKSEAKVAELTAQIEALTKGVATPAQIDSEILVTTSTSPMGERLPGESQAEFYNRWAVSQG